MLGLKLCSKRLKRFLIREPRLKISTLATKCLSGIQGGKTKANMGNFISYGKVPMSFMLTEEIMLSS